MHRTRLPILLVAAGALSLLLWMGLTPPSAENEVVLADRAAIAPPVVEEASALAPVTQDGAGRDEAPEGPSNESGEEPAAPESSLEARPASEEDAAPQYPLHVHFVDASGESVFPSTGQLLLEPTADSAMTADEAARRPETIALMGARSVVCPIAYGAWRLRVESPPFHHLPETILAVPTDKNGVEHKVTLWSESEIPVRMRTTDSRAVWAYAEDLAWEEKNLLYKAFEFRSSSKPFTTALRIRPAPTPNLRVANVEFHAPHGHYSKVSVGDDIVGHVQRNEAAARWVGLWVHDQFHSEQFVDPNCTELIYFMGLDDLLARAAQVTLTVIDRETKEPLQAGVKATLKANHAPYRRDDMKDRAPTASGDIKFENVLPGEYELLVERASNTAQRKIRLATETHLDVGVIELGNDAPLVVRVLGKDGKPRDAWVEVAEYVQGGVTKDLYHPSLFRHTDRKDKTYAMPIPDRRCIVRARLTDSDDLLRHGAVSTVNVLVDPLALPPKLDLLAQELRRVEVSVETPWKAGHRLEIREETLDLAVHVVERPRQYLDMLEGTYVTRHLTASGRLLGEGTIEVKEGTSAVSVP